MEDVIERYRNEFILDNLRLVKPFTLVSDRDEYYKVVIRCLSICPSHCLYLSLQDTKSAAYSTTTRHAPTASPAVAKGDINLPQVSSGDKSGRLNLKKGERESVKRILCYRKAKKHRRR